jgi:hypothetical protein
MSIYFIIHRARVAANPVPRPEAESHVVLLQHGPRLLPNCCGYGMILYPHTRCFYDYRSRHSGRATYRL